MAFMTFPSSWDPPTARSPCAVAVARRSCNALGAAAGMGAAAVVLGKDGKIPGKMEKMKGK